MDTMSAVQAVTSGQTPEVQPSFQAGAASGGLGTPLLFITSERADPVSIQPTKPPQYVIQGRTLGGQVFRPGDWAERLAGAM